MSKLQIYWLITFMSLLSLMLPCYAYAQYPGYTLVNLMYIGADDSYVTSGYTTKVGGNYLLEASGTWIWDKRTSPTKRADARWLSTDDWTTHYDSHYDAGLGGLDPIGLYVDGYNDSIWGDYSPSHVYIARILGNGSRIRLHILDEFVSTGNKAYMDNTGGLYVKVYEAVPEPSGLAALLCGLGGIGGMVIRKR